MTKLILIRHGETDYNLYNKYCGSSDPPLNEKGIFQARRLKERLKDTAVDKVYSSDLKRAFQTAEIVFENCSIEKLPGLREINFGVFEGLNYEEIIERYPAIYNSWIENPAQTRIPDAETLRVLACRVRQIISLIISRDNDKNVAVITHSGPIRVLLCDIMRYDLNMFWQIKQNNGALNVVNYLKDGHAEIEAMNE